jgi:hypothetical protein
MLIIFPMNAPTLDDIIRDHVNPLIDRGGGWYATRCLVCQDHAPNSPDFKGFRGNFKFDPSGTVGYNCYNCDHKAKFDPSTSKGFSKNMRILFDAFQIPDSETSKVLMGLFMNEHSGSANPGVEKRISSIDPIFIDVPDHFYDLSEAPEDDVWAKLSKHYLEKDRLIKPSSYKFWLSTDSGWFGRLIIPIFKDGSLIYYEGRSLVPSITPKYKSAPNVIKSKVMYNYDALFTSTKKPLFVTEGFFDAFLLNGVAVFGKALKEHHIAWLKRSHRDIVFVIDKFGDGKDLGMAALENGWKIATPDFGDCKDVTEAIHHLNKLYVLKELMKSIYGGEKGKIMLDLYCK